MSSHGKIARAESLGEATVDKVNARIALLRQSGRRVLDCCQALVDLAPPPQVIEALRDAHLRSEVFALQPCLGNTSLREEIASYRQNVVGTGIGPANVLITAGANHGALVVLSALLTEQNSALLISPYFFNHQMQLAMLGANATVIQTEWTGTSFEARSNDLATLKRTRPDVMMITDPVNPTGEVWKEESLRALQEQMERGVLVVDETYCELRAEPVESSHQWNLGNVVLLGSFSKSMSLAGMRVGYVIASEERILRMIKTQDASMISAGSLAQDLALAALRAREAHLPALRGEMLKRAVGMKNVLKRSGLFSAVTGGNGVQCFAKIAGRLDSISAATMLLDAHGVACLPGDVSGASGVGWLRFCFGRMPVESLDELERSLPRSWKNP